MAKCGACGKFLSPTEAARCSNTKCQLFYHRPCVGMDVTGRMPSNWHCPECKKNVLRDNRAETPVRGHSPANMDESVHLMDTTSFNNTALDITQSHDLEVFRAELRSFREEFLITVRNEFQLLRDDLSELRSSLNATNDRMSRLEERVATMESAKMTQASTNMDEIIAQLKSDINDRDQELLANDVQLSNLPEISGENPIHTVMLVASKMGVKIKARDIVSAERVGGRRINATQPAAPMETRPRFLAVRFARRELRDELLESARVRRGMTTADLDMPGAATRFYVNERLTKLNRELFRRAREAGGRLGWQFIWAKRGRIFARNKPGDSVCHIRNESDLQRIFGPCPNIN